MKLRIKETGEVLEDVKFIDTTLHKITIQYLDDGVLRECSIKNLSDIEEVKDYEEPKAFGWRIDEYNEPEEIGFGFSLEELEYLKEIGLLFKTKEETEKAVERLKAWKRLEDKGFRFKDFEETDRGKLGDFTIYAHIEPDYSQKYDEFDDDLYLLFGSEQ